MLFEAAFETLLCFSEKIQETKKSSPQRLLYVKKITQVSSFAGGDGVISQELCWAPRSGSYLLS